MKAQMKKQLFRWGDVGLGSCGCPWMFASLCPSRRVADALAVFPGKWLPSSLQCPIRMNEAFECKEFCSPSARGESFGR